MNSPDALSVHRDALLIDGHCDTLGHVVQEGGDLAVRRVEFSV